MKRERKMELYKYIEAQNTEEKKREWEVIRERLEEEGIWKDGDDQADETPSEPKKGVCRKTK